MFFWFLLPTFLGLLALVLVHMLQDQKISQKAELAIQNSADLWGQPQALASVKEWVIWVVLFLFAIQFLDSNTEKLNAFEPTAVFVLWLISMLLLFRRAKRQGLEV